MRSQSMEPPIAMSLDRYTLDVLRVGKKLRTVALLCCYMDCKPCRQLDVPTHTHTHTCLVLLCMQHMVVFVPAHLLASPMLVFASSTCPRTGKHAGIQTLCSLQ